MLGPKVSWNGQILESSDDTLILMVFKMLSCLGAEVPLAEAEINQENNVWLFALSYANVLRLHVSVDERLWMEEFKSGQNLSHDFTGGPHWELLVAELKQRVQIWAKNPHDHAVEVTLHAEVVDLWHTRYHKEINLSVERFGRHLRLPYSRFITVASYCS